MLIRLFFSVPILSVLLCVSPASADVGELSSSSVHAYQTEFKEADQNKDGVLDGEELKAYLQPFPEEMFEILVRRRSSQGHVAATVEDLLEVAKLMKRWKGYDPRVVKSNRLLWEYADRNDDGTLDKEEISQGKLVSGHRQILLEKMDASSQGITFSSFMDAFGEFLRDVEMRRTMENILYRHHGAKDQPISSLLTAYEDKDEANVQEKDERKEEEFNSRHADYFRSFDTNGDEVISGKEGHELPRSIKSAFFGATLKDGELHVPLEGPPISIDQFHEVVESLYQARLKKILAQRHAEGEQDRQRGLDRYISSLLPGSTRSRGNDTDDVVTIESSPHASYFQHLDQDGNGVVEGDEFANLPSFLESGFHQRFPDAWSKKQITIREFHTYWENLKRERSAAKRRSNEDRRYAEYRAKLFSSDEVDPQVTKKPESEEAAAVANAPADTAAEATINDKTAVPDSCTVDIVLIRRAQEDLPERTLAEEVMSMLKEPGPPLSAKLLPWLADKSN
ncbi:EF-hand domain-containing protein [Bremerella sp. T1]|uniref:EF-hand domain-containing protein n=1 Tax=Bremerella sp. TYQ1 TaxID=3119568 RepID=UPI001CC8F7B1|nr:EF-hand domain-containing protein [Bremerella volcania]UBM36220.1 EF-hand domain-containing protein [Bremerella volcania]